MTTGVRAIGLAAAVAAGGYGCAARGPSPQLIAEVGKAAALQQVGCYRCLIDALATYERVLALPRPPSGALQGAFETSIMLAVRSKELGLSPDNFLAKARELGSRLTPPAAGLPPAAYLDAAAAIVGETSGFDPERRQQLPRRVRGPDGRTAPLPARGGLTAAVPTDALAAYLGVALDCDDPVARSEVNREAVMQNDGATPAMRFRLAICGIAPSELIPLRERDPRWIDTLFFEGRRHMTTRPVADVAKAEVLFAEAHAAFPESHAITLALAGAQNALSEYDHALALYDEVLRDEPTHRDARLGRVMSLSYLNRYVDAVAAASGMIELGTWHIGDAYYWRAWNRYQLHQLPMARDDVEHAMTLLMNTSVYTLAGFITYAQVELDTAIERFDRAFALDNTNCEAVWFAALVHVDQQAWSNAAPKFSRAMTCFASAAADARAEIARLEASASAETAKARALAAAHKRLDTAEHRGAQAAYNAANTYVRLGDKALAVTHVDVAATHPLLKEKALSLKASIEKLPQ